MKRHIQQRIADSLAFRSAVIALSFFRTRNVDPRHRQAARHYIAEARLGGWRGSVMRALGA
jgi:hypothetical protein